MEFTLAINIIEVAVWISGGVRVFVNIIDKVRSHNMNSVVM